MKKEENFDILKSDLPLMEAANNRAGYVRLIERIRHFLLSFYNKLIAPI